MTENETISVSKGVFVFKNNFKKSKKSAPNKLDNMFSGNLWYQEYTTLWSLLNEDYEILTSDMFSSMTSDLLRFVKTCHQNVVSEIPTAALLTGINMPDHEAQFKNLKKQIRTNISTCVALLRSQDCSNLRFLIENMINQFVNNEENVNENPLKRSLLNLSLLQSWYEDLYKSNEPAKIPLVVIIPDFEGFNINVLQNFISVVSSYVDILPFVFIFGIATSVATLHTAFPYHVTSKINIQVFNCKPSIVHLNKVLETVFLCPHCPFQLGGNVFNLFTEIFLYYDFSVRNFVQNVKYAMMEHFCYGNAMALCQMDKQRVKDILDQFNHEDYENVRQLISFRKLVESESYKNRILLLVNDKYFRHVVYERVIAIQRYIKRLHIFLKCLFKLVSDLPGSPLGKNLRELYALAVTKSITQSAEYKEAFQLLHFQSKEELSIKLANIIDILKLFINEGTKKTQLKDFYREINRFEIVLSNVESEGFESEEEMECDDDGISSATDRKALKEALLSRMKGKPKALNRYEKIRKEILDYLSRHFEMFLVHYSSMPFHEIFFFDDVSIKSKIIGMHRSAIHNALNDPHYYLQCTCCEISKIQVIKAAMPDICVAYKLHLECGKMINLYDWLQAFLCIVDPEVDDDFDDKSKKIVDPELQARFTQAVAELEYLGFIKSSKRKADHVARLTWGG